MKKAIPFFKSIIPVVPYAVFLLILIGCTGNTTDKSKKGDTPHRYPAGLIEGNLNESSFALHVVVNKVTIDETKSLRTDRGKIGYAALVVNCRVVDSYKGDLTREGSISFLSFWEYHKGLLEEQRNESRDRIVFLKKSMNGSYHALSYGMFVFTEALDQSLKKTR
jgi:hypothetical protein